MTFAIECRDLRKTYPGKPPVEAVRGIDLEVTEGECFGVLGPNGAGKTTTMEILEGLLEPTSGDVQILGMRWQSDGLAIRERIGISLQQTQLSEKLTVLETLTLFRSFYRTGLDPEEALASVSLEDKAHTWVKHLSGGQRQRLALAVALVGDPALVFLDEPSTGLDPHSRRQLAEIVRACCRQGRTTLLTTHYMEEAERLCDRVAIVDHGRILALGTPPELIARLGSAHIIEFSVDSPDATRLPAETWCALPSVTAFRHENNAMSLAVSQPHEALPALVACLADRHWNLTALATRQASLDDVFVQLTGRPLEPWEVPA